MSFTELTPWNPFIRCILLVVTVLLFAPVIAGLIQQYLHRHRRARKSTALYKIMQSVNVLSLPLAISTPIALSFVGLRAKYTTKYDYLYSIEQFVPEPLVKMWFGRDVLLPIQTIQVNSSLLVGSLTVYFPGVAIDCVLGTVQGIVLGMDLWKTPVSGKLKTPYLHASTMFCYAIMCIAAMPLHCLKDVPIFDISTGSLLTETLFWVDTFATSCVPPFMLLSGLIESETLALSDIQTKSKAMAAAVTVVNAFLTYIGVFHHQRWLTFFAHIAYQTIFLYPLMHITKNRVDPSCHHRYFEFMLLSKLCSLVSAYTTFMYAGPLIKATGGSFCVLTCAFVGLRIGMVQYWVYAKRQAECSCHKTKVK